MSRYDLNGKVIFVTGGAEGIGRCLSESALSKQAKVFFVDIQKELGEATQAQLGEKYGADNVGFAVCDVSNRQRLEETFQQAVSQFGQIDVMVNNAGILGETKPEAVITINLLGTIYGTEIAQRYMRKDTGGKGGRIINVSSVWALYLAPYSPIYAASKQGVLAYTKSLSMSPIIDEIGVEYGLLLPDSVATQIYQKTKEGDVLYLDRLREQQSNKQRYTSLEHLSESFLDLVTLEKMNGAMLLMTKEKRVYMKVYSEEVGETYPPPGHSEIQRAHTAQ